MLDRVHALLILEGYGAGPQVFQLLTQYWDSSTTEDSVSGYYGYPFQGYWVDTQGDPLPPCIFKIMLDTIICN